MFIKFKEKEKIIYLNIDKIVSICEDGENQTMITTINPNEFYQLNQPIEEVIDTLRRCGYKMFSTMW